MPSRQVEQTFGLMIAYVFPGMIALYAAGLHVPLIQSWYKSPALTEFLLLIILSAGAGVFLSGVRWIIFEKALKRLFRKTATAPRKQHDETSEQTLQGIIMQLYRYYQFYANTSVAAVCVYLAWLVNTGRPDGRTLASVSALLVLLVAVLGWSALEAWRRDQEARQNLYSSEGNTE